MLQNVFTVDLEDYFQVSAFNLPREAWENRPLRIRSSTWRLLELLEARQIRATFFVLGWVAQRCPELVRAIVEHGHELASHGFWHQRVNEISDQEFREDIIRSKGVLEQISGVEVVGYRAPSFSLRRNDLAAYESLRDTGYQYSSSIYPIRHDHYGDPGCDSQPFSPLEGILELPLSTYSHALGKLPVSGGGYFRLFPYAMSRQIIRRLNEKQQHAVIFYIHPWEVDPAQPRMRRISLKTRFRHYLNLSVTESKLSRLMQDFHWASLSEVYLLPRQEQKVPKRALSAIG